MFDTLFMKDNAFNVKEDFSVGELAEKLSKEYKAKNYKVNCVQKPNRYVVEIDNGKGGISAFFGKKLCLAVSLEKTGSALTAKFYGADWLCKFIGIGFGVILCYVPTIMSIIGCLNQNKLYKAVLETISSSTN